MMKNRLLGCILFSIIGCSVVSLAFATSMKVVRIVRHNDQSILSLEEARPEYKDKPVRCWNQCQQLCIDHARYSGKDFILTWVSNDRTLIDSCSCALPHQKPADNAVYYLYPSADCRTLHMS